MKKYLCLIIMAAFIHLSFLPAAAMDVFGRYEKVIWINQHKQIGTAYEDGKKLLEFPVLTGDDVDTTNPGIYVIKKKVEDYYSKKFDTPMPYSMFFDLKNMKAIHEGAVPPPQERKNLATHGCIHVEEPYMIELFDWADEGHTAVVIQGWRDKD
jgi:lipoprotein-anchoring transpeptidase ErfK/SrfK